MDDYQKSPLSPTIVYEKSQMIVSSGGIFELKIIQNKNRNTEEPESYTLFLGGKSRKCFNLLLPSRQSNNTTAYLAWVEAHDECSFEKFIDKGFAQHMIALGITIARDINPRLKIIEFDDNSNFMCTLPSNKKEKVPMSKFHLFFHQTTWYEHYFDAKLIKDYEKYENLKQNFNNPANKPPYFNFINSTLQDELEPIYRSSDTWKVFADKIAIKYDKKKCGMVYPWIRNALYVIFENDPCFESSKWYINLEDNKMKNKTHPVYFESYRVTRGGNKTRKRKVKETTNFPTYILPNIREVTEWDYKCFIKST